ncbi:SDR family oxidoreductase [bacterium]|nr:MAG: SDR family oxidoreductase [bacterium]
MKTILITGASSGIGKAVALTFAERGWNVVATMRDPHAGEDLAKLDNVLVTRLDVQDAASIPAAVEAGIEHFGGIDILLNNAGMNISGAFEELSATQVREIFDVNVFGVMEVARAVLPHFRARRAGVVANLTSAAGLVAFPLQTLYVASKHAVEGFSETLAYELLPLGITVKLIEPGLVRTRMTEYFENYESDAMGIADYQAFTAQTLQLWEGMMGASMTPANVAAERIYNALTDGTPRLRYVVTDDVAPLVEMKHSTPNEEFVAHLRSMFVPTASAI